MISKLMFGIIKDTGIRGPEFSGNVLVVDKNALNVCRVDGFNIEVLKEVPTNGDESVLVRKILDSGDIKAIAIPESKKRDYSGAYGRRRIFYL